SARYRGRPDPSTTVPFLITRSYDILNSPRDRAGSATYSDFELKGSPRRRHLLGSHYRCPWARSATCTVFFSRSKRSVFFVSTSPPVTRRKNVSSPYSIEWMSPTANTEA